MRRCLGILSVEIRRLEEDSKDGVLMPRQQEALIEYAKVVCTLHRAHSTIEQHPEQQADLEKAILEEAKKILRAKKAK